MTIVNGYCTAAQLRGHLGYQPTEVADDTRLELAVNAASRQIDGACGWRFYQDGSTQIREFSPESSDCVDLVNPMDPGDPGDGISTTVGLVVKIDADNDGTYETTLTSGTDFLLMPRNAATRTPVWPYTSLRLITSSYYYFPRSFYNRPTVQVTAKFGWPAVPDDITQACLIQAAQIAESKLAVFGAVALGDTSARSIQASLNPMARALVAPYKKPSVG